MVSKKSNPSLSLIIYTKLNKNKTTNCLNKICYSNNNVTVKLPNVFSNKLNRFCSSCVRCC